MNCAASGAAVNGPWLLSVGHGPAFDRSMASRAAAASGRAASRSSTGATKAGASTDDIEKRAVANDNVAARAARAAAAAVGAADPDGDAETRNDRLNVALPAPILALNV